MAQTVSATASGVPFLDLAPQHAAIRGELLDDLGALLETGAFTNGPQVAAFEQALAAYVDVEHAVGTASGLDALRLAMQARGLGPGDEVIVPAMTFVATAEAVSQTGARPVLVDVTDDDYCIDPAGVAAAVTARTSLVLPVHLYGQLADMRTLGEVCAKRGLPILEDACQAHGAHRDGISVGRASLAAAFSFYPGKNLGAIGDAGALVTGDAGLAESMRALREHGQVAKYRHEQIGWTARLDTVQAVVLLRKLPWLDRWNAERRAAAALYDELLEGVGDLRLPPAPAGEGHVWHLYVVRTGDPSALAAHLAARGIATGRHYPEPVHLTAAYADLGYAAGSFPVAEAIARECLSLPIFPGIGDERVAAVARAIADWFARSGR